MLKAKLIVIEGIDGSGKATQAQRLLDYYTAAGQAVRLVSFPDYQSPSSALVKLYLSGGIGAGETGSVNAYAASCFYAADRYISYQNNWRSGYEQGLILADRYTTSNLIHQMAKLPREEWPGFIEWLHDFEYERLGLPAPDLVLYLDLPLEAAQRLLDARYGGDDRRRDIHERDLSYLAACRQAATYAADRLGWHRIACTEAGELRSVEAIANDIINKAALL
jgi:dTMP kinase